MLGGEPSTRARSAQFTVFYVVMFVSAYMVRVTCTVLSCGRWRSRVERGGKGKGKLEGAALGDLEGSARASRSRTLSLSS